MTFLSSELSRIADRRWEAFCKAAVETGQPVPGNPSETEEIRRVFGLSGFIASSCRKMPGLPDLLIAEGILKRPFSRDDYRRRFQDALTGVDTDSAALVADPGLPPAMGLAVRGFRQREMVRIAWRDLTGKDDLEAILSELSALADVCIDETLSLLYEAFCRELGTPVGNSGAVQRPVVIGMGKLGAEELNFSSDVDLIFAYPESGETEKGIGTDAFFSRLCQKLIMILSQKTADGFVFRVDTNLRPFGEGGPLVSSFTAMERYYQSQGREWERYAWIKARPTAGDRNGGRKLIEMLRPFVYRRYLDYGVFEALREMKRKIAFEVRRHGMENNIKLGAGGIREVEFFGQIFQLIRGGVAPALQQPGILSVLGVLEAEHYVHGNVCRELRQAYRFLRLVENRIQADEDRQTHELPSDAIGRVRLAEAMTFENYQAFETTLTDHRNRVHGHFSGLLEKEETRGGQVSEAIEKVSNLAGVWQTGLDEELRVERLAAAGFDPPDNAYRLLQGLKRHLKQRPLSSEGQQRLDRLMPRLLAAAGSARHPVPVLKRLLELIRGIRQRTNYLALLIENPTALDHLVRLSDASSLIASFVARHPVLLDELLDPRTLYSPPGRAELATELNRRVESLSPNDLEEQIEEICIFRQAHSLRIAAADVTGTLPLMRVSDHLTDLAEIILAKILQLVWTHLARRHGYPSADMESTAAGHRFAVIAYGKLGGLELGYGSDLDLVFLHAAEPEETTNGSLPIDAPQFFSRLGQRMIHILTTHTRAGRIYEVDMRLRPSGNSGPLVSHIRTYESYLTDKAWTWEHQALIRARAVAGDPHLCEAFEKVRQRVLSRHRERNKLRGEVVKMRERLRAEQDKSGEDFFDLKQGPGGIVDIEFLVQYLVLSGAARHPDVLMWSDNVRHLESLVEAGMLTPETAYLLREAYLTYRSAAHRMSLQEKPGRVRPDRFAELRERVTDIYRRFLY